MKRMNQPHNKNRRRETALNHLNARLQHNKNAYERRANRDLTFEEWAQQTLEERDKLSQLMSITY